MIFTETKLQGVFCIDLEPVEDERGWFARSFCKKEFMEQGLWTDFVQHNLSFNHKRGTIRGMHYQRSPYEEIKVVQCMKGSLFDVIVDLRQDAGTYLQWISVELNETNGRMLYIPKGFAHGFQTLVDETAVYYLMSDFYEQAYEAGIRWDDKQLQIAWPIGEQITISEKDQNLDTIGEVL